LADVIIKKGEKEFVIEENGVTKGIFKDKVKIRLED
jgi:hypothetical protein